MDTLVDWWTVRGDEFGIRDYDFKVELRPDSETRPGPGDTWDEATLDAYADGDWRFVTVRVIPVSLALVDYPQCAVELIGVAWGDLPDGRIDRGDITDDQVASLMFDVANRMLRAGLEVLFAEESPYLTGAPF